MQKKIGFWPVIALVIGSQIGSGVFILPANLASYGVYSIYGWALAGVGAISLAIVFAFLCSYFPKTGGPHAYVEKMFGSTMAFFTGWTYWVISWVSTTVVIIAAVGYLTPFFGEQSSSFYLILEIGLLALLTTLNLGGVQAAGRAEFFLSLLKFIPLLLIPAIALLFFDSNNFAHDVITHELSVSNVLGKAATLALWGFIGVESATTPAGSVHNPSKTIPIAIVLGTTVVALVYTLNSVGIMGLIDSDVLRYSKAPYVDVIQIIFGGNWHLIISIVASVACIGTVNAWILTSGQIALGNAEDGLMPPLFSKTNKNNAPDNAILISAVGMIPFLILTKSDNFVEQLTTIIDFSVTAFLYVYLICCISLIKMLIQTKQSIRYSTILMFVAVVASGFCCWLIYECSWQNLLIAFSFVLTGIPVYVYMHYKNLGTQKVINE